MYEEVVKAMMKILKGLESGEHVIIYDLLSETKLASKEFMKDETNLMIVTSELMKATKKERIYLESIFGEDAAIGMPFNITYAIKRKYDPAVVNKENCIGLSYKEGGYMCCRPAVTANIDKSRLEGTIWDSLMDVIFSKCKVQNWYDSYVDYGILDGYYWELELRLGDGTKACFSGSNKEPRNLKTLVNAIKLWIKEGYEEIDFDEKRVRKG